MFKNADEIRYGIKTINKLAYPVMGPGEEVVFVIQLESKVNKRTNKNVGFTQADEQVIKLVCLYLTMHAEKSTIRREINADEQEIIETLQLCSEICTQQSF